MCFNVCSIIFTNVCRLFIYCFLFICSLIYVVYLITDVCCLFTGCSVQGRGGGRGVTRRSHISTITYTDTSDRGGRGWGRGLSSVIHSSPPPYVYLQHSYVFSFVLCSRLFIQPHQLLGRVTKVSGICHTCISYSTRLLLLLLLCFSACVCVCVCVQVFSSLQKQQASAVSSVHTLTIPLRI